MQNLLYDGYDVVFQEVPDEVALTFNITGCPHRCPGCHSEYLWEYHGDKLTDDIDRLLDKYDGLITAVCLMGGDYNLQQLCEVFEHVHKRGLKTCLYTGADSIDELCDHSARILRRLMQSLDYLKLGHYDKELGGLSSFITNQVMWRKRDGRNSIQWDDITYKFWHSAHTLD